MDKSLISCWTIFFYTQPEAEGFTVDHYRWVTAATVSFCPTAQMASAGTLWTNHHLALLIYSTGYYRFAGGCRNRTAYTWIIKDDKKNSVKGNPNLRLRFCFSLKVKLIAVALENGAIKHSYWTFTADLVSELIAICTWPKQMSAFGKLIHVFVQNIQIKEAVHPQIKKKLCTHIHVVPKPFVEQESRCLAERSRCSFPMKLNVNGCCRVSNMTKNNNMRVSINNDIIFIFGRTNPLNSKWLTTLKSSKYELIL